MHVLILDQALHLIMSYRNQAVWRIPDVLMKGVSQSQFLATMLLGLEFVNRSPGRYERRSVIGAGRRLLIDLQPKPAVGFFKGLRLTTLPAKRSVDEN
jgi:hypothetical protein